MDEEHTIIRFHNVQKSFPGVRALKEVTLDIRKGEILGLIGENGAGKSTLVKILAGIYKKDGGELYINGKKASIADPADAQKKGLSFIFQDRFLAQHLTVQENLFAGRQPVSCAGFINWKQLRRNTQEILDLLKCRVGPNIPVYKLSVAEQQIVEIGRAISLKSEVIVMDEPTSSLSDEEANTLFGIMKNLSALGVTIVFISHRLNEVLSVTDRIAVMRDGELVKVCTTTEETPESLIRLMVGRELTDRLDRKEQRPPGEHVVMSVRDLNSPGRFEHIGFDLREGEILGFAGLVGAGRSAVLKALFGLDKQCRGEVRIRDGLCTYKNPNEALNCGICYLSEDRKEEGVFPFLSVAKNMSMASLKAHTRFGFVDFASERRACKHLVEELSIKTPDLNTLMFSLSGGNQQKAIMARGFLKSPRIFLLDEPTAGIDVGAKFEIYTILRRLAAGGIGIVLVSSELNELLGICHRIIVMCQGRITAEFEGGEADQEAIMRSATKFRR